MIIGGITWWRNNYGSILQAYALQEYIKLTSDIEYEIINQYGSTIYSANNILDKIRRIGLKGTLKKGFWKIAFPGIIKRNKNIQHFVDSNLNISNSCFTEQTIGQANDRYDGFICGSDQIWNTSLVSPDNPIYWLKFAEDGKRKISYAPSIGVSELNDDEKEAVKSNLSSFHSVSCREETGTKAINEALGEDKCVTVLDPTLLVDRTVWDNISCEKIYEEPYLFVYLLRGTKAQRKKIEDIAKAKNLKIVTIPFLDSEKICWYDSRFGNYKLWDASPADFVSAIRYSEFVITDSFHCMIFSCLYHREFLTFPKIGNAQMNRITGLQELFQMSSRMIDESTPIDNVQNIEKIDWELVDRILHEKRASSRQYLDNALKVD